MSNLYNVNVYDVKKEGGKLLSKNFTVREFACQDGSRVVLVHQKLVVYLQQVRDHFGKPLIITSGYRTVTHNSKVGGVADSQHIFGSAVDCYIPGIAVSDLYSYFCEIAGNSCGIGIYNNFVHFDVRPTKSRWDSRKIGG